MGYGGKQSVRSGDIRRFNFTGNGSNTIFDLGFTPATQNQLIITVNGLVQHYDAFSISGSTLTFTGTPASGDTIQITAVVDAVGVATNFSVPSQWVELPFAQTLIDEDAHHTLVHGKPITNGIINLNLTTPDNAQYVLNVSYIYNTTLLISQGTADFVF
jgi:hypothetical protein